MADTCCSCCGSRNLIDDEHEGQALVVCSDCGHVSSDSAVTLELNPEYQVGVLVDADGTGALAGYSETGREGVGAADFQEARRRSHWQAEVRRVADQLQVSAQTHDLILGLVSMVQKDDCQISFNWAHLATACAYIVIRQEQLPLTLRDVAVATGVHVRQIARCFKLVLHHQQIQLPAVNLHALVTRHVSRLLSSIGVQGVRTRQHPVMTTSLQLVEFLKAREIAAGSSPLTVGLAVIKLALEAHISNAKRLRWMNINAQALLNIPRQADVTSLVARLKSSLLSLCPLLPHLPPGDALAIVRHCGDVLALNAFVSKLEMPVPGACDAPGEQVAQPLQIEPPYTTSLPSSCTPGVFVGSQQEAGATTNGILTGPDSSIGDTASMNATEPATGSTASCEELQDYRGNCSELPMEAKAPDAGQSSNSQQQVLPLSSLLSTLHSASAALIAAPLRAPSAACSTSGEQQHPTRNIRKRKEQQLLVGMTSEEAAALQHAQPKAQRQQRKRPVTLSHTS